MQKKVLFIDFEDSFSYNIVQRVGDAGFECQLIHYEDFNPSRMIENNNEILLLGPGPGHISDYQSFISKLDLIVDRVSILGVCLGHQMLCHLLTDLSLEQLDNPIHGQSLLINAPPSQFQLKEDRAFHAQFYNSWAFMSDTGSPNLWLHKRMVIGMRTTNTVSFQFHPESIGTRSTICPIRDSLELLYNSYDGQEYSHSRTLRFSNSQATF